MLFRSAALVPQHCRKGGRQQQRHAAVPGMRRQIVIGISKIPDIIGNDVTPGHIRPQHILLVLGRINAPPAGHTENIDNSCNTVHHIVPASIKPYALRRQPPGAPSVDSGLKIAGHGDQNIDSYDGNGYCSMRRFRGQKRR